MKFLTLLLFCVVQLALAGEWEDANAAYIKGDYEQSMKLIEPLAKKGELRAQFSLGNAYAFKLNPAFDLKKSIEWKTKAAQGGFADAQKDLAVAYLYGIDVNEDSKLGLEWLNRAISQGHAGAQNVLGRLYATGKGVPQDYERAAQLFKDASKGGGGSRFY